METDFTILKTFKNGGVYKEHISVDKSKFDYKIVKNTGIGFARLGKNVTATPVLHYKSAEYAQIYGALENTKYYRKSPDLLVDGKFYEVESFTPPFKKDKINGMLRRGIKQSPYIVLNNSKGAADRYIKKMIYDHINVNNDIKEVWLYEKGNLRLLYKNSRELKNSLQRARP